MPMLLAPDWHAMFTPTMHLGELVLRGSLMYLFILALLRIFRREAGALSTTDLLVIVLVADAAQNALANEYHSLTEGAVLVGTIFLWNYVLDWLAFRVAAVHRILHPRPLLLIADGRVQHRHLQKELLTVDDLKEKLREQGVEDVTEVRRSYLESDGQLSVVRYQPDPQRSPKPKGEAP